METTKRNWATIICLIFLSKLSSRQNSNDEHLLSIGDDDTLIPRADLIFHNFLDHQSYLVGWVAPITDIVLYWTGLGVGKLSSAWCWHNLTFIFQKWASSTLFVVGRWGEDGSERGIPHKGNGVLCKLSPIDNCFKLNFQLTCHSPHHPWHQQQIAGRMSACATVSCGIVAATSAKYNKLKYAISLHLLIRVLSVCHNSLK